MAGQNDPQSAVAYRILGARPAPKSIALVGVGVLPDGALCWCTSNQSLYIWQAYSTTAPLGDDVILPEGRTVAEPGRWHRQIVPAPYVPRFSLRALLSDATLSGTVTDTGPLSVSVQILAALRGSAAPLIMLDPVIAFNVEPSGAPGTNTLQVSGTVVGPAAPINLPPISLNVDQSHPGTINFALPILQAFAPNNAADWTATVTISATGPEPIVVSTGIVKIGVYGFDPAGQ